MRVFDDATDSRWRLWFELAPDRWYCGEDVDDAADTRFHSPAGLTLARLQEVFPNGKVLEA